MMNLPKHEQLTLWQEGSLDLVNLTVLPGSGEARRMTVTSGQKCLGSLKNSDLLGLLERMLLTSSIWNSTERYLTWKYRVTEGGRLLYQLAPSMPNIEETEYSLLPTPTASDATTGSIIGKNDTYKVNGTGTLRKVNGNGKDGSIGLGRYVQFFPTPQARDWKGTAGGFQKGNDLPGVIGGKMNPMWQEWLMGFPTGWTELNPSETQ